MFRYIHHVKRIHFVGIGGAGMNGIAELLFNLGYKISGSDLSDTEITDRLKSLGVNVYIGHNSDYIKGADVVVYSSAITETNCEVVAARANNIPVIPRSEMLGELMRLKYNVAVAGAHGKTTTTSMIATILTKAELDPTVVIGGKFYNIGGHVKSGLSDFLIAEIDESDGHFLALLPIIAIITNIDAEHLDHYNNIETIKNAFVKFINKVPFYGCAICCMDNEYIREIKGQIHRRMIGYGLNCKTDIIASNVKSYLQYSEFVPIYFGKVLDKVRINTVGLHYVSNALAAVACGLELNVPFETIRDALNEYRGVQRRFEIKGVCKGILLIDDYGHHPTEIMATLAAGRIGRESKRIIVVFQPHRYSRTQKLYKEFGRAFFDADIVIVTGIYSASEEKIPDVDSSLICKSLKDAGHANVIDMPNMVEIPAYLERIVKDGDVIITLGAGDVYRVGEELIRKLSG